VVLEGLRKLTGKYSPSWVHNAAPGFIAVNGWLSGMPGLARASKRLGRLSGEISFRTHD
jgi:hypothetical protein